MPRTLGPVLDDENEETDTDPPYDALNRLNSDDGSDLDPSYVSPYPDNDNNDNSDPNSDPVSPVNSHPMDRREATPEPAAPSPIAEVAPITIQKRPRGRPKKDGTTPLVSVQVRPIPRGPHIEYDSDKVDPSARPESFLAWFSKLDPEFRHRCKTFLYRNWPYGRYMRKHAKTGVIKPTRQIDKEFRMYRSTGDILRQWGSGSYTIMVRDSAITTGPPIATCYIKDLHNDDLPPVIHNLEDWLDKDYPANKSFVEGMRARGIKLPGDTGYDKAKAEEEGSDEMSVMQRIGERLVESVVDNKMNPPPQQQQYQQPGPRIVTRHTNRDKGSGAKDLAEIVKVVASMQPPRQDPFDMMLKFMEVQRASAPSGDSQVMQAVVKSLDSQAAQITRLVESTVQKTEANTAAAVPKTRVEMLRELAEEKKLMREISDEDEVEDKTPAIVAPAAEAVAKATGIEAWVNKDTMPIIMMGFGMLANIVHNATVAITKNGQPEAPPQPMMPGQTPGPSPVASNIPTIPSTAPQYQPVSAPPPISTALAPVLTPEEQAVALMIQQMEQPWIRHMSAGKSGIDYAAAFIDWFDRLTYDQMSANAPDVVAGAMRMYSPALAQVMNNVPPQFDKFLNEFLTAGPVLDSENNGGDDDDDGEGDGEESTNTSSTATTDPTTSPTSSTPTTGPTVVTRTPKKKDVN